MGGNRKDLIGEQQSSVREDDATYIDVVERSNQSFLSTFPFSHSVKDPRVTFSVT